MSGKESFPLLQKLLAKIHNLDFPRPVNHDKSFWPTKSINTKYKAT